MRELMWNLHGYDSAIMSNTLSIDLINVYIMHDKNCVHNLIIVHHQNALLLKYKKK